MISSESSSRSLRVGEPINDNEENANVTINYHAMYDRKVPGTATNTRSQSGARSRMTLMINPFKKEPKKRERIAETQSMASQRDYSRLDNMSEQGIVMQE